MEQWWCKLHSSAECHTCCLQPTATPAVAQSGSTAPGDLSEYFSSTRWDAFSGYVGIKIRWFWELSWAGCNSLWNQQWLVCQIMKDSQFCLEIDQRFFGPHPQGDQSKKFRPWKNPINFWNRKRVISWICRNSWSFWIFQDKPFSSFFNTRLQLK